MIRAVVYKVTRNIDATQLDQPKSQLTVKSNFECAMYCATSFQGFVIVLGEDINNCRLFQKLPDLLPSSNENYDRNLFYTTLI